MKSLRVFFVVALLASCSPKGAVIPSDPAQWGQIADKAKQLSPEDHRLFAAYMARKALSGALRNGGQPDIPPGTTIDQAIEDQRKFETEAADQQTQDAVLRAKATAARTQAEAALNQAATVTLVSMTLLPKDFSAERFDARESFVIAIQNKSAKDIWGIKGDLEFDDLFGAKIKTVTMSMEDKVPAGQIHTTSDYYVELNQFERDDNVLAASDLSQLKVTFHPEMIVFADGTRLAAPGNTDTTP